MSLSVSEKPVLNCMVTLVSPSTVEAKEASPVTSSPRNLTVASLFVARFFKDEGIADALIKTFEKIVIIKRTNVKNLKVFDIVTIKKKKFFLLFEKKKFFKREFSPLFIWEKCIHIYIIFF